MSFQNNSVKKENNMIFDAVNATPEDNYVEVPNDLIQNAEISGVAYKVLLLMYYSPVKTNLSNEYLSQFMKEGKTAIASAKKELENKGYLKLIRLRSKCGKHYSPSYAYCVLDPEDFNIEDAIKKLNQEGFDLA